MNTSAYCHFHPLFLTRTIYEAALICGKNFAKRDKLKSGMLRFIRRTESLSKNPKCKTATSTRLGPVGLLAWYALLPAAIFREESLISLTTQPCPYLLTGVSPSVEAQIHTAD